MRKKLDIVAAAVVVACLATPVIAHHGFDTEYDAKKFVKLEGVIKEVTWTNPHMRIYIDVKEPSGTVTTWNLELGAVNSVLRRGWKPADLKVGATVSFKGYGGRKILTRAAADALTLPDGRSFTGASGAPDAPAKP
jgi:hypothetical protein